MSRRDWISYQPISSRTSPITRSWIPYGRRTTSRTILDSDGFSQAGRNRWSKWTDQNGRVKRGSGHFNPFHMTII